MYNCVIYPNEEEIQEYREKKENNGYSSGYIERKVLEYKQEDITPNEGYYWVDNVDISEKIKTVPPEPTRDGYAFEGWFIEPECINEFDFENDTVIDKMKFLGTYEENSEEDNQEETQENTEQENQEEEIEEKEDLIFYAKWIEE